MTTRTPMMAGNWKMNLLAADANALVKGLRESCDATTGVDKVLCPPYILLRDVHAAIAGSSFHLGAQNLYWEEKGAFTGEVSVTQIAEVCEYVIIGHSERRQYFGETDETVNKRVQAALAHGLKPIMCVGETQQEREAGQTTDILARQTRAGIAGASIDANFVVAYEPVWAIGTGLAADGATAEEAIALIRDTVREQAGAVADSIRILYGGSVTPENIAEYIGQPNIDGGLIGGASLKVDAFSALIAAAAGPA